MLRSDGKLNVQWEDWVEEEVHAVGEDVEVVVVVSEANYYGWRDVLKWFFIQINGKD